MISRRGFLSFLGLGAGAVVAAPLIRPTKTYAFLGKILRPRYVSAPGRLLVVNRLTSQVLNETFTSGSVCQWDAGISGAPLVISPGDDIELALKNAGLDSRFAPLLVGQGRPMFGAVDGEWKTLNTSYNASLDMSYTQGDLMMATLWNDGDNRTSLSAEWVEVPQLVVK